MDEGVWTAIDEAVRGGDAERVVDLRLPLEDGERRRLSKQATQLEKEMTTTGRDWVGVQVGLGGVVGRRINDHLWAQSEAAAAAVFCLGPPPGRRSTARVPAERLEEVVRSRPRAWRDKWAARAVHEEWNPMGWRVLRALLREGECDKPEGADYVRAMVRQAGWLGVPRPENNDLHRALLEDPELLEGDVWRLFELEEKTLTVGWFAWGPTLVRLANEGVISRDRLLDESLAALRRDFAPAVAQSFSSFHEGIKPTPAERAAREPDYRRLLASPVESTVGFALRNLAKIDRATRVDGRALLEYLPAALAVRAKAHAKGAVSLLARVLAREPALVPEGLDVALGALSHESADVQSAALELIRRYSDELAPGQHARLAELVDTLDPSLRPPAADIVGLGAAVEPAASVEAVVVPEPVGVPESIPRLRPADAITPVQDVDELLDLAAVLLERPEDPDELERFVDGVSRLCAEPVPEGRRAAVVRRAEDQFNSQSFAGPASARVAVAALACRWLKGTAPGGHFAIARGGSAAIGRRLDAVAKRAASRRSSPLLSAPTHRGGWLDPVTFAERLLATVEPEDDDLAQAVLRLAPERRVQAVEALGRADGEAVSVALAALGQPARRPRLRSRLPASWDSIELLHNPDTSEVEPVPEFSFRWNPGLQVPVAPPSSPARLMVLFEIGFMADGDPDFRRWLAHIWPGNREPFYAVALRRYGSRTIWLLETDRETIGRALEPMLDPDEPFGPRALELLAAALGSVEHNRLLAADVTVEAIRTRRLPPTVLGREIGLAMVREGTVPDRWAASLEAVHTVSALHAHEVQRIIESALATLGDQRSRMTKLLDLLRRIAQDGDARIEEPAARAWLEGASGQSKTGKLAKAALAVGGRGAARSLEAAAAAREGEQEQALRWSGL